jgi:hypothetical protein
MHSLHPLLRATQIGRESDFIKRSACRVCPLVKHVYDLSCRQQRRSSVTLFPARAPPQPVGYLAGDSAPRRSRQRWPARVRPRISLRPRAAHGWAGWRSRAIPWACWQHCVVWYRPSWQSRCRLVANVAFRAQCPSRLRPPGRPRKPSMVKKIKPRKPSMVKKIKPMSRCCHCSQ